MDANPSLDKLSARDLQMLESPGMINDEIVNFHLGLCQLEALQFPDSEQQSWLFLNTYYYDKLSRSFEKGKYNPKQFRQWFSGFRLRHLSKRPWYEHTHVFIPIHKGLHWVSVVIELQSKTLICYDPLQVRHSVADVSFQPSSTLQYYQTYSLMHTAGQA